MACNISVLRILLFPLPIPSPPDDDDIFFDLYNTLIGITHDSQHTYISTAKRKHPAWRRANSSMVELETRNTWAQRHGNDEHTQHRRR